jgi:hypothetical protein
MNDTERLEFLISCLNEMEMFYTFVNNWADGFPITPKSKRATPEEWRQAIDQAAA